MQGIPLSSSSTTSSTPAHWDPRAIGAMPDGEAGAGLTPAYNIDTGYSNAQSQYAASSFPYVTNSSSSPGPSSSYRPRSGDFATQQRSSYLTDVTPSTSVPLQYPNATGPPRQNSIASVASHDDYSSPLTWSHSQSPSLVGSRNNSIYSLDGQMGSMAVGGPSAPPPPPVPTTESSAALNAYGGFAPPSQQQQQQQQQHRGLATAMTPALHDRRFSLDDRRSANIRTSQLGNPTPGRSWPWGGVSSTTAGPANINTNGAGPLGSVSSSLATNAPFNARASYDYGSMGNRSLLPGSNGGSMGGQDSWQSYDGNTLGSGSRSISSNFDTSASTRVRAMSSGATGSRVHPYATPYDAGHPTGTGHSILFGRPSSPSRDFDQLGSSSASKLKLFPPSQSPSAAIPSTIAPGIGPGGGVTRRTKFKRSRTGCLVCRKRKVKCSQDGTPCRQCRIGKRDCYYPAKTGKGQKKGGRRQSMVSVEGDEESEEGSYEEDGEGNENTTTTTSSSSFDASLLPRPSQSEEQLHNFGGAAPIARYEPLYAAPAPPSLQGSHDHQRNPTAMYDGIRSGGAVDFHMPFDGHSTPQNQVHHHHQHHHHHHNPQQHQQQHYAAHPHSHATQTSSIESSVRSIGSAGSAGGDSSSFDTGASTGPTSIGSVGAASHPVAGGVVGVGAGSTHHVPLLGGIHSKVDEATRGGGGGGGPPPPQQQHQQQHGPGTGGQPQPQSAPPPLPPPPAPPAPQPTGNAGWYDPVAAVLKGEDGQTRYF